MANESVTTNNEPAIQAFACYESSVFLGWLEAVGDIMLFKGEVSPEVAADLGGLILALSAAARELQRRERADLISKHANAVSAPA